MPTAANRPTREFTAPAVNNELLEHSLDDLFHGSAPNVLATVKHLLDQHTKDYSEQLKDPESHARKHFVNSLIEIVREHHETEQLILQTTLQLRFQTALAESELLAKEEEEEKATMQQQQQNVVIAQQQQQAGNNNLPNPTLDRSQLIQTLDATLQGRAIALDVTGKIYDKQHQTNEDFAKAAAENMKDPKLKAEFNEAAEEFKRLREENNRQTSEQGLKALQMQQKSQALATPTPSPGNKRANNQDENADVPPPPAPPPPVDKVQSQSRALALVGVHQELLNVVGQKNAQKLNKRLEEIMPDAKSKENFLNTVNNSEKGQQYSGKPGGLAGTFSNNMQNPAPRVASQQPDLASQTPSSPKPTAGAKKQEESQVAATVAPKQQTADQEHQPSTVPTPSPMKQH